MQHTEISNNIAQHLDIGHLPVDQQEGIIEQFTPLLIQGILSHVLPAMSEEQIDVLQSRIDGDMPLEELFPFFAEHVDNFEDIVTTELHNIKTDVDMLLGRYMSQ